MFRRILFASVGAIALAGSALAADLPSRAPPPVYVPPAPIFTWTGVYVGGQVGYAWGNSQFSYYNGPASLGVYDKSDGVIGGAHVGYNLQLNQFVIGLEGDVDGSSNNKTVNFYDPLIGPGSLSSKASVQGSIRGRVGLVGWDRFLIYGTGGVAFAGVDSTIQTLGGYNSASQTRVGWTVGGGVEYAITNNWSVRAEYRYSDFGHTSLYSTAYSDGVVFTPYANRRFVQNRVQVGFSYKFDTFGPPAPVVAKY